MADAQLERTTVEIAISGSEHRFVAVGEVVKFDGFLRVYAESKDDEQDEKELPLLPSLHQGLSLTLSAAEATQRYTQQPSRYTEASLVKKMEELGIGRPSTYAPTISTIQTREYVEKYDRPALKRDIIRLKLQHGKIAESKSSETYGNDKNKLMPTDIGMVVTDFLSAHFPEILNYNFTANVEEKFDEIAEGKENWTRCIDEFYKMFHPLVTTTLEERTDRKAGERILGKDPKTGHTVSVKISRFGPVVQVGAQDEVEKPQFASLQKGLSLNTITLEEALHLFDLPKVLGNYEEAEVSVNIGRFGPYVKHSGKFYSLNKDQDPYNFTLDEAIDLITEKRAAKANQILRTFDEDPELQLLNGRFGPYLTKGGKNYRFPKNKDPQATTYEECVELIKQADESEKSTPKRGRRTK
jgi:DNA topoisomerase-1